MGQFIKNNIDDRWMKKYIIIWAEFLATLNTNMSLHEHEYVFNALLCLLWCENTAFSQSQSKWKYCIDQPFSFSPQTAPAAVWHHLSCTLLLTVNGEIISTKPELLIGGTVKRWAKGFMLLLSSPNEAEDDDEGAWWDWWEQLNSCFWLNKTCLTL